MELIYFLAALFAIYWVYKGYKWIEFKNKYPILSNTLPGGVLDAGDIVYIDNRKYKFDGIDRNHSDILYVFLPDDSITPVCYNKQDTWNKIDAVYGIYGIKWKRV